MRVTLRQDLQIVTSTQSDETSEIIAKAPWLFAHPQEQAPETLYRSSSNDPREISEYLALRTAVSGNISSTNYNSR